MKGLTLWEGIAFALLASFVGSILSTSLNGILPGGLLFRWLLAGFGCVYVLYLMGRSQERVGRVVVAVVWFSVALTGWWVSLTAPLYVLVHLMLIWLVRSLYHHGSILCALADLSLLGLGLATASWAFAHTGSVFLGIWCFFLVQSLFVLIPRNLSRRRGQRPALGDEKERFECAHRNAEAAFRNIHSSP